MAGTIAIALRDDHLIGVLLLSVVAAAIVGGSLVGVSALEVVVPLVAAVPGVMVDTTAIDVGVGVNVFTDSPKECQSFGNRSITIAIGTCVFSPSASLLLKLELMEDPLMWCSDDTDANVGFARSIQLCT